jgi:hypothetical protein
MSIEGRIAIDVSFADSTNTTGVQSLKKISLVDTTSYSSGKVAIITGVAGTTTAAIATSPTVYKDASGSAVSFSTIERVAFSATPAASIDTGQRIYDGDNTISSRNGQVTVVDVPSVTFVYTTAGTATYTLVLYGT